MDSGPECKEMSNAIPVRALFHSYDVTPCDVDIAQKKREEQNRPSEVKGKSKCKYQTLPLQGYLEDAKLQPAQNLHIDVIMQSCVA